MATRYAGQVYYEPTSRRKHSTEIIERKVYCWAGDQDSLLSVHDSKEKRLFLSVINIFDIETGLWSKQITSGNPPLGVSGYSSTTIMKKIYFFGGYCGHGDCCHNSLSSINVEDMVWTELFPTTDERGPAKKYYSGIISFKTDNKEECLLLVGGYYYKSPRPPNRQPGAQYADNRTNETHFFNITTGHWISPLVAGRPPPCYGFTLLSLSGNRAVLYGGTNPATLFSDCMYIGTITGYQVNWEIIHKPVGEYPVGRRGHAATVISGCVQEKVITIGGMGTKGKTLNECWVIDTTQNKHKKIHLPDDVTKRCYHSLSSLVISPTSVLLIVFGGRRSMLSDPINETHVIELVYNDETSWTVGSIWGPQQLANSDEYHIRLFQRLWEGRGTYKRFIQKELQSSFDQIQQQKSELLKPTLETNEEVQSLKRNMQQKEGELLLSQVNLREKDEKLQEMKHKLEKLQQDRDSCQQELIIKEQVVSQQHQQLTLLNNELQQSQEKVKVLESNMSQQNQTAEKWKKDRDSCQQELTVKEQVVSQQHQQLTLLNNELQQSQEKVKALESNMSQLNQTAEKWKKVSQYQLRESQTLYQHVIQVLENTHQSDKAEEIEMIPITECYQKSEVEVIGKKMHSEEQSGEVIKSSYLKKHDEPHGIDLERQEKTSDLHKDLLSLVNEVVTENQSLKTELRRKEGMFETVENKIEHVDSCTKQLQNKKSQFEIEDHKRFDELSDSFEEIQLIKTYKEAEVQVNYLVHLTDRLVGVHVAAEKEFIIEGDRSQSFGWEDFGLKIHFLQGTLLPTQTCECAVKALVGGKFQFPKGTQLVSAVYAISFADELLRPVTLELQHCVLLESEEQVKYLHFMIAPINKSALPYKFHFINGGKFNVNSQYGTITRKKFCLVCTGKTCDGDGSSNTSNVEEDPSDDTTSTSSDSDTEHMSNSGNVPTAHDNTSTLDGNTDGNVTNSSIGIEIQPAFNQSESEHIHQSTCDYDMEKETQIKQDENGAIKVQPNTTGQNVCDVSISSESTVITSTTSEVNKYSSIVVDLPNISYPSLELLECKYIGDHYQDDDDNISSKHSTSGDMFHTSDTEEDDNITGTASNIGITEAQFIKVPDNTYTGQVCYIRKGTNIWWMKFIVVLNVKVFIQYMQAEHSNVEMGPMMTFRFQDPINGYIELNMTEQQEKSFIGWSLDPQTIPLRIAKVDADSFGCDDCPIPPSCLVTVWATVTPKTVQHLSYTVPLICIAPYDVRSKKICIDRFLDSTSSNSTSEITSQQGRRQLDHVVSEDTVVVTSDEDRTNANTNYVIQCIRDEIQRNYGSLRIIFEDCIKGVAAEMLQAGVISLFIGQNPSFDTIINCFLSTFTFAKDLQQVEQTCRKFFSVFYTIGGPFVVAADTIKSDIQMNVRKKLSMELNI